MINKSKIKVMPNTNQDTTGIVALKKKKKIIFMAPNIRALKAIDL
jgi:hypothetical protein